MEKNSFQLRKNNTNKKKRYAGFTLMECLLSLLIVSIICLFLSSMIQHTNYLSKELQSENEKMWHIFLIQLDQELKNTTYERTMENKIILKNNKTNHPVLIELKKEKIIKVDNGGYQPMLTKVAHAKFEQEGSAVTIQIMFNNQQFVEAKWIIKGECA